MSKKGITSQTILTRQQILVFTKNSIHFFTSFHFMDTPQFNASSSNISPSPSPQQPLPPIPAAYQPQPQPLSSSSASLPPGKNTPFFRILTLSIKEAFFFSGSSFILAFHFLGYVYLCM